ncbi:MAG: hypothetical protein EU544_00530 [Promethearchaeota archaeon]|nr:MAG: hypothetical protein EU544_00530 [Candidatus Lokiarchaeota archaeon]
MNFAIPRNKPKDYLLYIWKILDLPSISFEDLVYRISFNLFLDKHEEAKTFINHALEDNLLKKDSEGNLTLSPGLKDYFEGWQEKRRKTILDNIEKKKKSNAVIKNFAHVKTDFNVLLKAFLDKGTLNRAAPISNSAIEILEKNLESGQIKAKVAGSKEEPYILEIDKQQQEIVHNCHDFVERRAKNKKFCKHIAKFFLFLKDEEETTTLKILKDLAENMEYWEFKED